MYASLKTLLLTLQGMKEREMAQTSLLPTPGLQLNIFTKSSLYFDAITTGCVVVLGRGAANFWSVKMAGLISIKTITFWILLHSSNPSPSQ